LQTACLNQVIDNCYEISRKLFVPVIRQFIVENITETMFA
ncbi:MAG: IS701 family transposase, partial [Synechocystis sp.]